MISQRKTLIERDVHLLEDVNITHVSLVDKPANRRAWSIVKRAAKQSHTKTHITLDGAHKEADSGDKLDKVDGEEEPKGRWVRSKTGQRYFIPDVKKPRTRDVTGGKSVPTQHKGLPKKPYRPPGKFMPRG